MSHTFRLSLTLVSLQQQRPFCFGKELSKETISSKAGVGKGTTSLTDLMIDPVCH
jgi:hypothetical protein